MAKSKKKKFNTKAFKKWLDVLCKVVVKTRDGFACQMRHDEKCSGTMVPLDFNCQWCHIKSRKSNNTRWDLLNAVTGCGHCHSWGHDNPNEFGVWFAMAFPARNHYLSIPKELKTWREDDFKEVEAFLLIKTIDLKVDPMNVPAAYRIRFIRKIKDLERN